MVAGEIVIAGHPLVDAKAFRDARGQLVSYVPQNPGTSLNPSMRIGTALRDMTRSGETDVSSPASPLQLLERVGLPSTEEFARRYPHQLSGGQQQRVCIAAALASNPAVIVLDEPTTGLDVVTQDRILKELLHLRDERQVALLYITHDLAVVAQIADRIAVMYAGRIVEQGKTSEILSRPKHPYTRGLMASTPDHVRPRTLETMDGITVGVGDRPHGCTFATRCSHRTQQCVSEDPDLLEISPAHYVRCFEWGQTRPVEWRTDTAPLIRDRHDRPQGSVLELKGLSARYRSRSGTATVARDVSLNLEVGGCVALVGESGSGKTTIARSIAGLHEDFTGTMLLSGEVLAPAARRRTLEQRRRIQIVFQNPGEALNPRHSVSATIERPARMLQGLSKRAAEEEVVRLLEAVRLPAQIARRYPGELSGGERQRVAIARALAARPDVVICDEVTSALDVSVQAVVLELLTELRAQLGLSLLFITHDLGVVATVAERILVLERGVICEEGTVSEVLSAPQHAYTKTLLDAAAEPEHCYQLMGEGGE